MTDSRSSMDWENEKLPMLTEERTEPVVLSVSTRERSKVSGWTRSNERRLRLALPPHVMLFQKRARFGGARKRVMVDKDRLAEGASSTRSSDRYCLRVADRLSEPHPKRRFRPPSESMDWVTSTGLKEF